MSRPMGCFDTRSTSSKSIARRSDATRRRSSGRSRSSRFSTPTARPRGTQLDRASAATWWRSPAIRLRWSTTRGPGRARLRACPACLPRGFPDTSDIELFLERVPPGVRVTPAGDITTQRPRLERDRSGRLAAPDGRPPARRVARRPPGGCGRPDRGRHQPGHRPSFGGRPPDGAVATSHEYGDATILPGLVDGHTHLVGIGDGTRGDDLAVQDDDLLLIRATVNARASSIRVHQPRERREGSDRLLGARGDQARRHRGPSMVVAGRAVTITGGHLHWFGGEANGAEGVRSAVRQLVKEGADFIKIMASGGSTRSSHPYLPAFAPDQLRAIVGEAPPSRTPDRRPRRPQRRHRGLSRRPGLDITIHRSMSVRRRHFVIPSGPGGPDCQVPASGSTRRCTTSAHRPDHRDEEGGGVSAGGDGRRPVGRASTAVRRQGRCRAPAPCRRRAVDGRLDSAWGRSRVGGGWLGNRRPDRCRVVGRRG